jgi:predicted GNAT family acetyltransferase
MADPLPQLLKHASAVADVPNVPTNTFLTRRALMIDGRPFPEVTVKDNPQSRSYDVLVDGEVAGSIVYERVGDGRLVFTHAFVEPRFRGHGVGNVLVRGALDDVRVKGVTLTNFCDFVASYINAHPEYADLLDATHPGHVLGY